MLTERFVNEDLLGNIVPLADYHPEPTIQDRDFYESLADDLKASRIAAAEGYLNWDWAALPATLFMEYARDGNRTHYEEAHFERRRALSRLVIGECIEARGRFVDSIVNGIWAICEESFWGVPAHNFRVGNSGTDPLPDTAAPTVDLFAAETAGLLAWTHYLLRDTLDAVTPFITARIRREVRARVVDSYIDSDEWFWMGLAPPHRDQPVNNWNVWCNSNCPSAALLIEDDAARRAAAVTKALRSVDRFLDSYHEDGGCDEGPGYWQRAGGSLFDCLDLLRGVTAGKIDIFDEPKVGNIGRFLCAAHISGDWYVNFADARALVNITPDLVWRYGSVIGDSALRALGANTYPRRRSGPPVSDDSESLLRVLPRLFADAELAALPPTEPAYPRDTYLPGIQFLATREREGTDRGLYLAAKGGHNAESHNHNDVGNFVVFHDGKPVLIDVGVETYTKKTFSAERYSIWTMQSLYHNLPSVDGIGQAAGAQFAARDVAFTSEHDETKLSMHLAAAYPPEAGIIEWKRSFSLRRHANDVSGIVIEDEFYLAAPRSVTLHLLCAHEPQFADGYNILFGESTVELAYGGTPIHMSRERVPITDAQLATVWGDAVYRVTLTTEKPVQTGGWTLAILDNPARRESDAASD